MRCWLAAMVFVAGCACTSDKRLVEIDEPIEAEIVWRTVRGVTWAGGGHYVVVPTGIRKKESAVLEAEGFDDRPLHEWSWSESTQVELTGDDSGARLAYREAGGEWRIIYLVAREHVFLSDSRHAALDWAKLPAFDAAVVDVFRAAELNRQECVLDEVKKRGGDRAVADVLIQTLDVDAEKAWDKSFEALPEPEQARVRVELRRRILQRAKAPALSRALRRVKLADPALAEPLLELTRQHARAFAASGKYPVGVADFSILLRASAALRPTETAPLACAAIDDGRSLEVSAAGFVALTRAGQSCEAAEQVLSEKLCAPEIGCVLDPELDRKPCRQRLAAVAKLELQSDPSEAADLPMVAFGHLERVALWASKLSKPPQTFERARARRAYRIDAPAAPACQLATRSAEPCRCSEHDIRASLCRASGAVEGETRWCRYRIDDRARRIHDVSSKRAGAWRSVAISASFSLGGPAVLCGVASDRTLQCRPYPQRDVPEREPMVVEGVSDVVAAALSSTAFCALDASGDVSCATVERDGAESTLSPARKLALLGRADAIAATPERVCARLTTGRVQCFSAPDGADARLLDPTSITRLEGSGSGLAIVDASGRGAVLECGSGGCKSHPAPWARLERVWASSTWTFALQGDGRVQAVPTAAITRGPDAGAPRMETIAGIEGARTIASGRDSGCALLPNGDVRCWTPAALSAEPIVRDATALASSDMSVSGARMAATLSNGSLVVWSVAENALGAPETLD